MGVLTQGSLHENGIAKRQSARKTHKHPSPGPGRHRLPCGPVSVAWYREALGLTHEAAAGVPEGVAFMVAPTGERLELLAVDVQPSTWDGPIAALRAGVPTQPGQSMTSTPPTRVRWRRAAARSGRPATRPSPD